MFKSVFDFKRDPKSGKAAGVCPVPLTAAFAAVVDALAATGGVAAWLPGAVTVDVPAELELVDAGMSWAVGGQFSSWQ